MLPPLRKQPIRWQFSLDHLNVLAYITISDPVRFPRIKRHHLRDLLFGLSESLDVTGQKIFLSASQSWLRKFAETIDSAGQILKRQTSVEHQIFDRNPHSFVEMPEKGRSSRWFKIFMVEEHFESIVNGIRNDFRANLLFGMSFIRRNTDCYKDLTHFSDSTDERTLVFDLFSEHMQDASQNEQELYCLDPVPPLVTFADSDLMNSGVLMWSPSGKSGFISSGHELDILSKILRSSEDRSVLIDRIDGFFSSRSNHSFDRKILHLSDLHFGTSSAWENRTKLKNQLWSGKTKYSRAVVTGDLFEVFLDRDKADFEDFRNDLFHLTESEVLVVPGNHDQKWLGNSLLGFGETDKRVKHLEWHRYYVDEQNEIIFLGFNSSIGKNFARGSVSPLQREQIENRLNSDNKASKTAARFRRIALIHHHPFSFETAAESILQRGLELFGVSDERFLAMQDADEFVHWCANVNVSFILHGHKHVQRYVRKDVNTITNLRKTIRGVGCGASLGAEGSPLTYNVLTFFPKTNDISILFFESNRDGSGFHIVKMVRTWCFED